MRHSAALKKVLLTLILVWAWAQVLSCLTGTGGLWSILGGRLALNPSYQAVSRLLEERTHLKGAIVTLGTTEYTERLRERLGKLTVPIAMDAPELRDVLVISQVLNEAGIEKVYIESLPRFWTDVQPLAPPQNLTLFQVRVKGWHFKAWPIEDVRLFFATIRDAFLKKRRASAGEEGEPVNLTLTDQNSLLNATFMVPGKDAAMAGRRFKTVMGESGLRGVFWLGNPEAIPSDLTSTDRQAMHALLSRRQWNSDLGWFVPEAEIKVP